MEKYTNMFNGLYESKGFKYAVDYMGTYFFGLLDNITYTDFIENYYDDFIDFTNWLYHNAPAALWETSYGDTQPLLYKLVDVIQETNAQPDSLNEALLKAFNAIRDDSKEPLFKLADALISHNNQIVMNVGVFDELGFELLYQFEDKFTKVMQKKNPNKVRVDIVMALSLVIVHGGIITFKLREKGKEIIYAFEGYNGNSMRSLSEEEMEDMYEDYIIEHKDIEVELRSYILDTSELN